MPVETLTRIPSEVLDAIFSLTALTTTFTIESAMDAGRADSLGDVKVAEARLSALATGVGVASGEVAYLVEALNGAELDTEQRADAAIAIAGLQRTMASAACAVQEVGRPSFRASAWALRCSAEYLDGPLAAVRP